MAYAQQDNNNTPSTTGNNKVQTVNFPTDDGVSIVATYYTPSKAISNNTTTTVVIKHDP